MSSNKLLAALPLAAICLMPHHASAHDQQGMVVVRDAKTGQLRAPTASESRALAPKSTPSLAPPARPSMITHASGARQVKLGERGLVYSVVTRDSNGKLDDQCVHGAGAAEHAVHRHAHAPHGQPAGNEAGTAGTTSEQEAAQQRDDKEGRHEVR